MSRNILRAAGHIQVAKNESRLGALFDSDMKVELLKEGLVVLGHSRTIDTDKSAIAIAHGDKATLKIDPNRGMESIQNRARSCSAKNGGSGVSIVRLRGSVPEAISIALDQRENGRQTRQLLEGTLNFSENQDIKGILHERRGVRRPEEAP